MSSTLKFDHAVILVNDLDKAIEDYRQLGFNAFFGGQHAGGKTHNALIVFVDGTYLELLAPTSPDLLRSVDPEDFTNFLYMFASGEGLGGYAMQSDSLLVQIELMQKQGLDVHMRPAGGRARPDGQQLRWQSAMIGHSMTPFFIQDDTPRVLRVPDEKDKTTQPNHVQGVVGVTIAVSNLQAGIARYRSITGADPQEQSAASATFRLADLTIRIVKDTSVEDRDDRLIGLQLKSNHHELLDKTLTHGADIELVE